MSKFCCSICGRMLPILNPERHKCPPAWNVKLEDYEDDETSEIRADNAAERYVEEWQSHNAEYPEKMTVVVERNGHTWRLIIQVEAMPQYTAYDAGKWEKSSFYPTPACHNIPERMRI